MSRIFLLLFVVTLTLPAVVSAQREAELFPRERLTELRREIVFEGAPEFGEGRQRPSPTGAPDFSAIGWPGLLLIGLVLAAALGVILYFTLRSPESAARSPIPPPAGVFRANDIVEEELVEKGVDPTLLSQAEAAGQYDLAIRLLYITALTDLNRAGVIRYRKDRGNRDYLEQLRDHPARTDFRLLTLAYERYWYGQYAADDAAYRNARSQYTDLSGHLSTTPATSSR